MASKKKNKEGVGSTGLTLQELQSLISKIRLEKNLADFKTQRGESFCQKHKITSGQLNFLLSVVAAERIKDKGILV